MAGQKRYNGEGSIRKRVRQGKTYWEGRYTNEEGKQKSVSAKTQKECREKLREAIDEAEQKKKIVPNSSGYDPAMTLNEWADICFKLFNNNVRETTIYINKLWAYDTVIAPKLGNIPLNEISKNDVLDLIQSMNDDYAHNSIETIARVLKNLLNVAVREDVIEESVAKDIIAIGGRSSKQKRELTQEEIDIFLEYAGNKREEYILAFHIMLNTGMRCGEVLALTWKDIDNDYTYMDVNKTVNGLGGITPPKTSDSIRKVPINPFLKLELKKRYEWTLKKANGLSDFNICNEYVITSKKRYKEPGDPRCSRVVYFDSWLKQIILHIQKKYPDYPMFSSHYLRHTFASKAVYNSMPLLYLQKICGWSNAEMLSKVYGHMTPEQSYEAMCLIPAVTLEACNG